VVVVLPLVILGYGGLYFFFFFVVFSFFRLWHEYSIQEVQFGEWQHRFFCWVLSVVASVRRSQPLFSTTGDLFLGFFCLCVCIFYLFIRYSLSLYCLNFTIIFID
jgi:hypothetical protein